jgi:hypothetical protein
VRVCCQRRIANRPNPLLASAATPPPAARTVSLPLLMPPPVCAGPDGIGVADWT